MAGNPDAGTVELDSTTGRTVIATTVAGSAVAMLTATVVNVALPALASDLGASSSEQQWVINAYLLSIASLILIGGNLGDRFGRVRLYRVGVVWFAAASLLCAVAPSIELLIAGRFLQGIGGALLTPGSLAIIEATFRQSDRGGAVGQWSGLSGIAAAVGPPGGRGCWSTCLGAGSSSSTSRSPPWCWSSRCACRSRSTPGPGPRRPTWWGRC